MYSMVLMMALTTGGEAPAFGHGCCGGYTSCCGGYTSCCGGYSSCCGGGHKLFGGLFGGHKHGCCGGYSCCGGSSCCGGCCGGTVIYSGCCGGTVAPAAPAVPAVIPEKPKEVKPMGEEMKKEPGAEEKKPEPKPEEKKPEAKEGAAVAAPATILVSLPADAKLTVDDNATVSTSANRRFVTPALQGGRDFSYTLKAEVVRDGKSVSTVKVITVRAGETTQVEIEVPTAVAAK